ncbi:MAG: outer membrane protein transport protein [Kofleriaceae bacterium]
MPFRILVVGGLAVAAPAHAGGLFLPGSGAISTSRAGAAVASVDDGEALALNPAGLAKAHDGWTLTISTTMIQYRMQFTRAGAYDPTGDAAAYEGTDYGTVVNKPKPPLGIGEFQPIPVIAVVTGLGGRIPGLRLALGLYAPNAYPFRDMSQGYQHNVTDSSTAPPPTRYDIVEQESQLLLPSVAVAYRVLPALDLGVRFTAGRAKARSRLHLWGTPGNVEEWVKKDTQFTAEVEDSFVPAFGVGLAFRPTPNIEIGANYSSAAVIRGRGTAVSILGTEVKRGGVQSTIGPRAAGTEKCETGGTLEEQKACISLQLPQSATVGARYKWLDFEGQLVGDLELDAGWENWGKRCSDYLYDDPALSPHDSSCTSPGQYLVVVDSSIYVNGVPERDVETNFVNLNLKDTFSLRLGGSYHFELQHLKKLIFRFGAAYDTRAAREGWLRANFDGASRVTGTLGTAIRTRAWELDLGAGYVHEGKNTNEGTCNPTPSQLGCVGDGTQNASADRGGPDPTAPILTPAQQFENPINQGTFDSSYLLFMLGFSTWF